MRARSPLHLFLPQQHGQWVMVTKRRNWRAGQPARPRADAALPTALFSPEELEFDCAKSSTGNQPHTRCDPACRSRNFGGETAWSQENQKKGESVNGAWAWE